MTVLLTTTIADGTVVPYYISDRRLRLSVARVGGRLYAFDDLCPCGGEPCPLSGGLLTGRTVLCQCHGSRFDVTTGAVLDGPALRPLNIHDVRETDGLVQIHVRGALT
jgi:3-phenylpropionate/trans-cinnamate dioxygenase ferredoxin component